MAPESLYFTQFTSQQPFGVIFSTLCSWETLAVIWGHFLESLLNWTISTLKLPFQLKMLELDGTWVTLFHSIYTTASFWSHCLCCIELGDISSDLRSLFGVAFEVNHYYISINHLVDSVGVRCYLSHYISLNWHHSKLLESFSLLYAVGRH